MRTKLTATSRFVHKHLWRTFVLLLVLVVLVGACFLWFLIKTYEPRKIADIPAPPGGDMPYELWYDKGGDLTLHPAKGNPIVTYRDYYDDDITVQHVQWLSNDRVFITMRSGTTLDIRVGFTIHFAPPDRDPSHMDR